MFVSVRGKYKAQELLDSVSKTGDTFFSAATIVSPVTSKVSLGSLVIYGTVVGAYAAILGFNDSTAADLLQYFSVTGIENHDEKEVPVDSPTIIYLKTSDASNTALWKVHGWIEDPMEYE